MKAALAQETVMLCTSLIIDVHDFDCPVVLLKRKSSREEQTVKLSKCFHHERSNWGVIYSNSHLSVRYSRQMNLRVHLQYYLLHIVY
ncbi:hypothetical protein ANTPLA_LOCUS8529 [Anthophora plagiata]